MYKSKEQCAVLIDMLSKEEELYDAIANGYLSIHISTRRTH